MAATFKVKALRDLRSVRKGNVYDAIRKSDSEYQVTGSNYDGPIWVSSFCGDYPASAFELVEQATQEIEK